jgi:hypothetical protein
MPRTSLTRHFRCHITVCYTQLITPKSADELPVVGGRCTGGAHRCKVKQGCREDRADVLDSCFQSSTVLGAVPRARKKIGNRGGLCYLIIAQGSDRRCGLLLLANLRGRSAGIVPVDGCLGHVTFISIVGNAQYFGTSEVPP